MAAPERFIKVTVRSNERNRETYFRVAAIISIAEVKHVTNNNSVILVDNGLEFYLLDKLEDVLNQIKEGN